MTFQVDAVYDGGVLKPIEPLGLPDQARVTLTVSAEFNEPESTKVLVERQRRAMDELKAELASIPDLSPDDGLSSADHDQILYGPSA